MAPNKTEPAPLRGAEGVGRVRTTLIGTSGGIAFSPKLRAGSAILVEYGDEKVLIDTGRKVVQNIQAAGHDPAAVRRLFFTHLHSDHVVGLPELILSSWVSTGQSTWRVVGPPGTADMVERLFGAEGAFAGDIGARAVNPHGRAYLSRRLGVDFRAPEIAVEEYAEAVTLPADGAMEVRVSPCPAHLQPWLHSLAYRISTPDGSVVITGDTSPSDEVAAFAAGCDLLIHDCGTSNSAARYRTRQEAVHTDPTSLAAVARSAGARITIATHIVRDADNAESLAKYGPEFAAGYDGAFAVAEDLMSIDLPSGTITSSPIASGATARV